MTSAPETFAARQARLMARSVRESYRDWMKRNCARWGIPWRDEYATPMDERPVSAARQDRALAGARKGAA